MNAYPFIMYNIISKYKYLKNFCHNTGNGIIKRTPESKVSSGRKMWLLIFIQKYSLIIYILYNLFLNDLHVHE